jgi:nucleotide-binding universal stress UspA family protein
MSSGDFYLAERMMKLRVEEELQQAAARELLRQIGTEPQQPVYQRILIALEGKEADEAVLTHVERLAGQMGAAVTLLRVICVADDGGGGLGRQFQLEVGSNGWQRKSEAEACLAQVEHTLRDQGLAVETALVVGTRSEGDEIVAYAAENGFDLITMASDSQPWYKRWIGGSPASEVQRKATVPTLFVSDGRRKEPARDAAPEAHPVMAMLGHADL